jgi:hypothetical protein
MRRRPASAERQHLRHATVVAPGLNIAMRGLPSSRTQTRPDAPPALLATERAARHRRHQRRQGTALTAVDSPAAPGTSTPVGVKAQRGVRHTASRP